MSSPKYLVWSLKTFPKNELVWVAQKGQKNDRFLAIFINEMGVQLGGNFVLWLDLGAQYERILSDGSSVPCGTTIDDKPEVIDNNIFPEDDEEDLKTEVTIKTSNEEVPLPKIQTLQYYSTESELTPHQHETALTIKARNTFQTQREVEVMKAYTEGKAIEWRRIRDVNGIWLPATKPTWDWANMEYRIAKTDRKSLSPWSKATFPKVRVAIRPRSSMSKMKVWSEVKSVQDKGVVIYVKDEVKEITYDDLLNNWEWVEYMSGSTNAKRCGEYL